MYYIKLIVILYKRVKATQKCSGLVVKSLSQNERSWVQILQAPCCVLKHEVPIVLVNTQEVVALS